MFDQTNDAELFRDGADAQSRALQARAKPLGEGEAALPPALRGEDGADVRSPRRRCRHPRTRTGSVRGRRRRRPRPTTRAPSTSPPPRFWVNAAEVAEAAGDRDGITHFLAYKDVTSPTNQRTMIAAMLPPAGVVNSAPIMLTSATARRECCLLANLNSFAYDYVARQKISNVHLNFFIVEQVPTLTPDRYDEPCPWSTSGGRKNETLEDWISERVLKLTCTAEDMLPLAEACDFTSGSFRGEYDGKLHKWNERERAELMAELDAAYFHLYGLGRADAAYILSTFKGIHAPTPLFGGRTTADHILDTYDHLAAHTLHAAPSP